MNRKTQVILFGMLLIFIGMSYFTQTINLDLFGSPEEKSEFDKELENYLDFIDRLRTAGFQYSGLGITADMNLYEDTPYYFYGQFWDSDNLEELFTQGWLEYKIVGDDTTFTKPLSVPENEKNGNGTTSNIQYTDGYLHSDGDLELQDGDYAVFNSSDGYHYPGTYSFTGETGKTGSSIYGVWIGNGLVLDYWNKHRDVLYLGSGQYTAVGESGQFVSTTGSIEWWFYCKNTYPNSGFYFSLEGDPSSPYGPYIQFEKSSSNYNIKVHQGGSWEDTGYDFNMNQWNHVRITFDCSINKYHFWYNGQYIGYYNFRGNMNSIYYMYATANSCEGWIDAFGMSSDTNYKIGANYYWQYYLGNQTFEEFDHSIKQNYFGSYDFEDYSLYDDAGDYYGNESFDGSFNLGKIYYMCEDNFENEENGETSPAWTDAGSGDQIFGYIDDHGKVLGVRGDTANVYHYFDSTKSEGRVEFYWRQETGFPWSAGIFLGTSSHPNAISLPTRADSPVGLYYYKDGTSTSRIQILNSLSTWYHFAIEWYSDYTCDVWVDGVLKIDGENFYENYYPDRIRFISDSNYWNYIDAYGETWESNYDEGDNLNFETYNMFNEWYGYKDLATYSRELIQYYHNYILKILENSYYHYPATYSFEGEVEKTGTDIICIDYSTTVTNTEVIGYIGNHKEVLKQSNVGSNDYFECWFSDSQLPFTIEFWYYTPDTEQTRILLSDDGNSLVNFRELYGNFQYREDGNYYTFASCSINTWYHIRIQINEDNTYDLWLDNIKELDDQSLGSNFVDGIDKFWAVTYDSISYFDAIGYSWDLDYQTGDNYYPNIIDSTYDFEDYSLYDQFVEYYANYMSGNYTQTETPYGYFYGSESFEDWYTGGHYPATYSFLGETGLEDNVISFVDESDSEIIEVIEELDDHKEVLNVGINSWVSNYLDPYQNGYYNGYIEFWVYPDTANLYYFLRSVSNQYITFRASGTYWEYETSSTWITTGLDSTLDTWHHIRIEWNNNNWSMTVDGITENNLEYKDTSFVDGIERFTISCFSSGNTYIDGYGKSTDSDYYIGKNLHDYYDGFYYGTYDFWNMSTPEGYYYGSYSFDNEIGEEDLEIDWIDYKWTGAHAEVISEKDGHRSVLNFSQTWTNDWCNIVNYPGGHTSGIWEFWFQASSTNWHFIQVYEGGNRLILLGSNGGSWRFWNQTTTSYQIVLSHTTNQWYHIKIQWYIDSTWDWYIDGVQYVDGQPMENTQTTGANDFSYRLQNIVGICSYIDAIGYDWDSNYDNWWNWQEYDLTPIIDIFSADLNMKPNCSIRVLDSIGGHNQVLEVYDDNPVASINGHIPFGENKVNGTIKFWYMSPDVTDRFVFNLGVSGAKLQFRLNSDTWQWYDGSSWITITSIPNAQDNVWHYIQINFDCLSSDGQYKGLGANQYEIVIDGISSGALDFQSSVFQTFLSDIYFATRTTVPDSIHYIDALSFNWDDWSHNGIGYVSGLNTNPYNLTGWWDNDWFYQGILGTNYSIQDAYELHYDVLRVIDESATGDYQGTYSFDYLTALGYYFDSAGFNYEVIGDKASLSEINWINQFAGTDSNRESEIISELDGHKYCLNVSSNGDNGAYALTGHTFTGQSTGIIEWWGRYTDNGVGSMAFYIMQSSPWTSSIYIGLSSSTNQIIWWVGDGGGGYTTHTLSALPDTWHHFKVEWDCSTDTWSLWVNGTNQLIDGNFKDDNDIDVIDYWRVQLEGGGGANNLVGYIDAPSLVGEDNPYGITYVESYNINPYDIRPFLDDGFVLDNPFDCPINITSFNGHTNVITLKDDNTGDGTFIRIPFTSQTTGTIEWWWAVSNTDYSNYLYIKGGASIGISLHYDASNNTWFYYANGVYNYFGETLQAGIWYHHRVDFNTDTDTFDWYINGTKFIDNGDFRNVRTSLDSFEFGFGTGQGETAYLDALSFSWDSDYIPGYNEWALGSQLWHNFTSQTTTKGISYWIYGNSNWRTWIMDDNDIITGIKCEDTYFYYHNGTNWINTTIALSDQWNHVLLYIEITADEFGFQINENEIMEFNMPFDMPSSFNKILFETESNNSVEYYLDAFIFQWEEPSSWYNHLIDNCNPYGIINEFENDYTYWDLIYAPYCSARIEEFDLPHGDVLNITDSSADSNIEAFYYFDTPVSSGSIDFWVMGSNTGANLYIYLYNDGGTAQAMRLQIDNDEFWYYDSGYVSAKSGLIDDTWYHLSIVFDCTTDLYDLYWNGELVVNDQSFNVGTDDVGFIRIYTGTGATDYSYFIDAFGYSWSPYYRQWDNSNPYGILYDLEDDGWGLNYRPYNPNSIILENSIHNKIWNITDEGIGSTSFAINFNPDPISGSLEYWVKGSDVSKTWVTCINVYGGIAMRTRIYNDKFQYYLVATGWTDISGAPTPQDNIWYHISIEFDCTTEKWNIFINGEEFGEYDFETSASEIITLSMWGSTGEVDVSWYLDAFGFTWDSNYPITGYNEFPVGPQLWYNFSEDISTNQAVSMWIYTNTTCRISIINDDDYLASFKFINETMYHLDGITWTNFDTYDGLWIHLVFYIELDTDLVDYYVNGISYPNKDLLQSTSSFNRILIELEAGRNSLFYLDAVMLGLVDTTQMWYNSNPYGLLEDLEDDGWILNYRPYLSYSTIKTNIPHNIILNMTDSHNNFYNYAIMSVPDIEYGTIELYMKVTDMSEYQYIRINDGSSKVGGIAIEEFPTGDWKYANPYGGWNTVSGSYATINVWYHIRIDFECTAGGYEGLAQYKYKLYVNGSSYGTYDFDENRPHIDRIEIGTDDLTQSTIYIDAIGFSWDSSYEVGYNTNPFIEDLIATDFNDTWIITGEPFTYLFIDGEYNEHKTKLVLFDNATNTHIEARYDFTAQIDGRIEFWIKTPDTNKNCTIQIGSGTSQYQVYLKFDYDGWIKNYLGTWNDICTYDSNEWTHIRIDFDCVSDDYDLYVNQVLEQSSMGFTIIKTTLDYFAIKTIDETDNYNISIDAITFSWIDPLYQSINRSTMCYLDFTMPIQIQNFTEDPLKYVVYRYQYTSIQQFITLYLYDFEDSEWDNMTVDNDTSWADLEDSFTDDAYKYVNDTGYIIFRIYGKKDYDEFRYFCDEFTVTIFHKSLFNTTLTLYQMGIWKYRFHVHSVSLSDVYTDWVYFDVIARPNNFEAISESRYATEWILLGTDISITTNVIYQDDFTAGSWSLAEGGGDSWLRWENLILQQDAYVWHNNPGTNYGSTTDLRVGEYGTDIYDYASYIRYDFNQPDYITEKMSGSINYYVFDFVWGGSYEYRSISTCGDFNEYTVTWNNGPAPIVGVDWGTDVGGWNSQGFTPTNFEDWNCFKIWTTSDPTNYRFYSKESGTNKPYINWYIAKINQVKSGEGYMYYQAKTSELVGIKSPTFTQKQLTEGDTIDFDIETDQDDVIIRFLLSGVQQKELPVLQYNSIYDRQDVQILIDEDISFDQIEVVSNLNNKDYVKLYNIRMNDVKFEEVEEYNYVYLQPYGEEERLLSVGETNLKIYENSILKLDENITIDYYDKYTKIYESSFSESIYVTLYDEDNELLDFNKFLVYANYTLSGNLLTNKRLYYNQFYADEGTEITFLIYDSFDSLVYNGSRYVETFIDITLSVYSLKIKNEYHKPITYDLTKGSVTKDGAMFPDEIIEYSLYNDTYIFQYQKEGSTQIFTVIIVLEFDRLLYINASKLCLLTYANQKGEYLDFYNYKTYINSTLIYTNTFYEDIGINISIEIKDRYGISIKNHSHIVQPEENYIAVTLTEYSLKVYNQQPYFNHINITRDPNYYTTEAFWSEWMAPGEIIDFRLFPGYYRINFTLSESSAWYAYAYTFNGDDILLIQSSNTIYNVLQDISNVNTTIGNQVTNVWIDLTNQNSNINNSIINIDIDLSSVNSTLGNMLLYQNLSLTNIENNISTLYIHMGSEFNILGTNINNSFIDLTSSVFLVNNTIYTAVSSVQANLALMNNTISGNLTILLSQNTFLTEMFQMTMFSNLLNWTEAYYNQTYLDEEIALRKFLNNYRDKTVEIQLKYLDQIESLRLTAQTFKEHYVPTDNVTFRVYSVSDGEYLTEWTPLTKDVDLGFYEEEVPEDLTSEDIPDLILTLQYWAIIIIFIVVLAGIGVAIYYKMKVKKIKKRRDDKKENKVLSLLKQKVPFY